MTALKLLKEGDGGLIDGTHNKNLITNLSSLTIYHKA